jgi:hypothetical protein
VIEWKLRVRVRDMLERRYLITMTGEIRGNEQDLYTFLSRSYMESGRCSAAEGTAISALAP